MGFGDFWQGVRDTTEKVGIIFRDPGYAAGTVSKAVSQVVSGQDVTPQIIPAESRYAKTNIGKIVAAPVALFGGAVSGEVSGIAGALLPSGKGGDKAREYISEHPIATTAALAAAVVAPGAIILGGANLASAGVKTAGDIADDDDDGDNPFTEPRRQNGKARRPSKKARRPRKSRPKRKRKNPKKRRRTR